MRNRSEDLTERFVEGYYLKNSWKAFVTHQPKIVGVGKHPGERHTCPVLILPWTAAFDQSCGRRTGLGGPWEGAGGAAELECSSYVPS